MCPAFHDREAAIDPTARLVGPVWIGAGRRAEPGTMVVGPAVLWDDPKARPVPDPGPWAAATAATCAGPAWACMAQAAAAYSAPIAASAV